MVPIKPNKLDVSTFHNVCLRASLAYGLYRIVN
jgi:hypothetical protein